MIKESQLEVIEKYPSLKDVFICSIIIYITTGHVFLFTDLHLMFA